MADNLQQKKKGKREERAALKLEIKTHTGPKGGGGFEKGGGEETELFP